MKKVLKGIDVKKLNKKVSGYGSGSFSSSYSPSLTDLAITGLITGCWVPLAFTLITNTPGYIGTGMGYGAAASGC